LQVCQITQLLQNIGCDPLPAQTPDNKILETKKVSYVGIIEAVVLLNPFFCLKVHFRVIRGKLFQNNLLNILYSVIVVIYLQKIDSLAWQ
jgi:hypothetical protein